MTLFSFLLKYVDSFWRSSMLSFLNSCNLLTAHVLLINSTETSQRSVRRVYILLFFFGKNRVFYVDMILKGNTTVVLDGTFLNYASGFGLQF